MQFCENCRGNFSKRQKFLSWVSKNEKISTLQKKICLAQFFGHAKHSFSNPVEGCSSGGSYFSAISEKDKTDFRIKQYIFPKCISEHVECSFFAPAENFREKAEKFHPKFRKH